MKKPMMRPRMGPAGVSSLPTTQAVKSFFRSEDRFELDEMLRRDQTLLAEIRSEMQRLSEKLDACRKIELLLLSRVTRYGRQ